jgi:hypothetical protein
MTKKVKAIVKYITSQTEDYYSFRAIKLNIDYLSREDQKDLYIEVYTYCEDNAIMEAGISIPGFIPVFKRYKEVKNYLESILSKK